MAVSNLCFKNNDRTNYILRIRRLAEQVAKLYVQQREALGFPLLKNQTSPQLN